MKSLLTFLSGRTRIVVFFVWVYALIELLQNQRYQTFLRPEFGFVLGGALLMFLGIIAAEISRADTDGLRWYEIQRPVILLIPLLFLLNAQGASLDYYTFSKRFTGTAGMAVDVEPSTDVQPAAGPSRDMAGNMGGGTDAPGAPGDARDRAVSSSLNPSPTDRLVFNRRYDGNEPAAATSGDENDDGQTVREVTVVELYEAPRLYEGKTVSVIGVFDSNGDVARQFGDRAKVLFRFLISCCAADAQPIAMIFETKQAVSIQGDNVWVKVTGRFTLEKKDGRTIPVLRDASLITVPKPANEYLY